METDVLIEDGRVASVGAARADRFDDWFVIGLRRLDLGAFMPAL